MSGPDRIYLQDAGDYESAADFEVTWCVDKQDDADTEYIRRETAVLAALPEVQALIAGAEARALDSVTTLHTVIADIRAATVGSKPMLSELAAALVAWRDEAVTKEREAIVTHINGRIDHVTDCAKWGGSKQYLQSLKGGVMELKHCAAAIRKRGEE